MHIKQAVILAGGKGERMKPLTNRTPKPMIEIHGKPFLWYIIENLKKNNIRNILLLVGYKSEQIIEYFGDGNAFDVSISYSYDSIETDTGTRIKNASHLLDSNFILLYGDVLWPLQIDNLLDLYNDSALMTVYRNRDHSTKNNVFVHNNYIQEYDSSRTYANLNGVNIGYIILNKKLLKFFPSDNHSFEKIIIQLVQKHLITAYVTDQKYYSLSTPDRIPKIEQYLKPKKVIFLDRDGVINKKPSPADYVHNWNEFVYLPNAKHAIQKLIEKGYFVYVVTNQAGIARGLVRVEQVDEIHKKLIEDTGISGVYMCPHGWDEGCFCRKPNPGLFFTASVDHGIDLTESICIGDDHRDIMAGSRAATKTILIGDTEPDAEFPSLIDAVNIL